MANLRKYLSALLGVSAYEKPANSQDAQDDLDRIRSANGGNLARPSVTQTRFYLADLEAAVTSADAGDMRAAAKLWRSMRRDGVMAGLLSTCTDGLVRLPKRFFGDTQQVDELKSGNGTQSVFDSMFPAAELALLAADGRGLGVGVGELVPVTGRDYPVFVRLEPEWLRYRWDENRWYYRAQGADLPITPGDGHWILHVPGGRVSPWQHGIWLALGQAWITKSHAIGYRSNWESKLANPARVAFSPSAATDAQAEAWFQRVLAWGVNTVFGLKPGYDVKLLESNGRGFESFDQTIKTCNEEMIIALAGQLVTTTGGTGFANADIHKSIRADIIKSIADSLAHTINTQGLPPWVFNRWGKDALSSRACVEWDVTPAKDRLAEANAMVQFANAIKGLREALNSYSRDVDVVALANAHGIPLVVVPNTAVAVTTRIELAPTDIAKVVRVDEARMSQGLPAIGDERGTLMITELDNLPASGVGADAAKEAA